MGQPIRYYDSNSETYISYDTCDNHSETDSINSNYYDFTIGGFNVFDEEYKIDEKCVIHVDAEVIINGEFHFTDDLIIKGSLHISEFGKMKVDGNIILNINAKLIIDGSLICGDFIDNNGVVYITEKGSFTTINFDVL